LPDPNVAWQGEAVLGKPAAGLVPTNGSYCKFHDRCPFAMPVCVEHAPPFFQTDAHRVTACYLYRESPAIGAEAMNRVFAAASYWE
jgi:peptide/nickel transport system ATP-binding protein